MKDELGGKIMIKIVELGAKTYSDLEDDSSEDKKAKSTKKCITKRKLKFENYKNRLEATQFENKINRLQKDQSDIDSIKKSHKQIKECTIIKEYNQLIR